MITKLSFLKRKYCLVSFVFSSKDQLIVRTSNGKVGLIDFNQSLKSHDDVITKAMPHPKQLLSSDLVPRVKILDLPVDICQMVLETQDAKSLGNFENQNLVFVNR